MLSEENIKALQSKAEALGPDLAQDVDEESLIVTGQEQFVPVVDDDKAENDEPKRRILEDPGLVLIADQPEEMATEDIDDEVEIEMRQDADELPVNPLTEDNLGTSDVITNENDEEDEDQNMALYKNLPNDIVQQIIGHTPQNNTNGSRFGLRLAGYREKRLRKNLHELDLSMEQYKLYVTQVIESDITSPRGNELSERLEQQAKVVMRCATQSALASSGVGEPLPVLRSVEKFMKTQTERMKSVATSQEEDQKNFLDQLIERVQKIISERFMRILQAFKKVPDKQSVRAKP